MRFLVLCWLVGLAAAPAFGQVQASLINRTEGYEPGQTLHLGILLKHDPHWHTYWINAGTGYPTTVTWDLPEGWTASEPVWPTPSLLKDGDGNIIGQGYEGEVLIPVDIQVPEGAQGAATLHASVDYLMCKQSCVPGTSELDLTLNSGNSTPTTSAWTQAFDPAAFPREIPASASLALEQSDAGYDLFLKGLPSAPVHFFPDNNAVPFDAGQTVGETGSGYTLHLKKEADGSSLSGVLTLADGTAYQIRPADLIAQSAGATDASDTVSASPSKPQRTLGATLALAFFGGMILNLMPCVFPVLGIKILGFVNQAGSDRKKVFLHGVAYTLGVLLSFWALAGVLATLRAGGEELGWGFQLQSPAFVFCLMLLMLFVGLNLSGLFEFGLSATGIGQGLHGHKGYSGSLFNGVLATVVATPCSAPFLAPALGAALTLPLYQSMLVFSLIGLGLAMPYLLLSLFPSAVKLLPRPGPWMVTFKQAMAFPVYATVALLAWVLAGQLDPNALLMALLSLPLLSAAVWLYGRVQNGGARRRTSYGIAAILLLAGLFVGYPRPHRDTSIQWEPWSAERVSELRSQGRTVYVDFTARWCFTCQTNKKLVFSSEKIQQLFADKNIATLRADWTNADPAITAELARWGRSAVPLDLLYLPGQDAPHILPEVLSPDIVRRAITDPDREG